MRNRKPKINMSYEPEADVLRIEAKDGKISYASEVGNVVVHFDRHGEPVYFEILDATRFLKEATRISHLPLKKGELVR